MFAPCSNFLQGERLSLVNCSLTTPFVMVTIITICFFVYYLWALIDYNVRYACPVNTFDPGITLSKHIVA
jgi:hypothetical protein